MKTIRIAAALVVRGNGDTLLVRKRGTRAFMQPGGKIEPGESPAEALVRELQEEIGLHVAPDILQPFGRFEAPAANEAGHIVSAEVFLVEIDDADTASSGEIEEVRWISPDEPGDMFFAELTGHHILPAWRRMRDGA